MTMTSIGNTDYTDKELEPCNGCKRPVAFCVCIYVESMRSAQARESEAVSEAYALRRKWECAAAIISNAKGIRPRGLDEEKVIKMAGETSGVFTLGSTSGWFGQ